MKIVRSVVSSVALLALAVCPAIGPAAGAESVSLSLRDAVKLAIENNLDIAVARVDPQQASLGVTVADAGYDSQIQTSANYTSAKDEPTSLFAATQRTFTQVQGAWVDPLWTGGQVQASLQYQESDATYPAGSDFLRQIPLSISSALTVAYDQPLLRNLGLSINRTGLNQAMNNLKISEADLRRVIIGTIETVERAYWDLVGARKQTDVARGSLNLAKDFLNQTKIKVEVGTVAPIEVTTAEAEVASREEAVIIGENAIEDAQDRLRAEMRVAESSSDWDVPLIPTDEPLFEELDLDEARSVEKAFENRPEVLTAALQLRNQELGERFRRNQLHPDLTASASYTASGNNFDFSRSTGAIEPGNRTDSFSEIPLRNNTNWNVGLVFSIPLGNRAARAEFARARLAVDRANLNLDAVRQQVRVEVRSALRGLETAAKRVEAARANVVLQRKKVEAEQKRYENGLSIAYLVLQTQADLADAESAQVTAYNDFNRALARLGAAQGTIVEDRGITLDLAGGTGE